MLANMPFAFIALTLGLLTTGGVVYSKPGIVANMDMETLVIAVVGVGCLVLMLWPGALVRVLYGRRAVTMGSASSEAPLRADKREQELLGP